ncbi:HU family DNA-binding protein [Bacillus sp. UNC438CL73TsuS30]|uniref:HU family DNA-binding protein n=1 Tax=Bacillus sp. UNC438CL73TsuS30 TaxID=1340434 RepID=UPI000478C621
MIITVVLKNACLAFCINVVDAIFSTIKNALINSVKVKFIGFGNFRGHERARRKGRDLQKGRKSKSLMPRYLHDAGK